MVRQSRHTVVCRAAQEASASHREYINRMQFLHLCSSVIPYLIGPKFATEVRSGHFRDTISQSLDFFFVFFFYFFSNTLQNLP